LLPLPMRERAGEWVKYKKLPVTLGEFKRGKARYSMTGEFNRGAATFESLLGSLRGAKPLLIEYNPLSLEGEGRVRVNKKLS